jgi:hypothetical protein
MAITQTINPMVNVPSISNLATFESDVDYTLNTGLATRAAEMNTFASQANSTAASINAQAVAMTLNATTDTSTTSNTIGTGAKTFTVSSGKSFLGGMYLVIADTAAPSTNSMFCQVTSYSGTTLVVNVIAILGSGTKTAWVISQSSLLAASNIYTQANVLGTVSQASGVPTGAIIETGTNANGTYTKWADGTMICSAILSLGSIAITTANGSMFVSSSTPGAAKTYPAAFIAAPRCQITAEGSSANVFVGTAGGGTNSATPLVYFFSPVSSSQTVSMIFNAIGRWF